MRPFLSLFGAVAVLLTGHGLQLSLLPLRAGTLGWSASEIGVSSSLYFGGFLLGCFSVPRIVRNVGHIRVFTVLTATLTAALLGIAILDQPPAWFGLRAVTGWSIAGLYLVIESWLNEAAGNAFRGAVLSIYTVTALLSLAVGQLLLNVWAPNNFQVIILAALLVALAAVPVGLTQIRQPSEVPTATFSPWRVFETSHAAVVSSFASGIVSGSYFGIGSLFGGLAGLEVGAISLMMATGILGGAIFQWPLGRVSDLMDRRKVIVAALSVGTLACVLGLFVAANSLVFVFFLFGGCSLPVYSLSLAHASDQTESAFLEVGTGILMVNASGAIIGPLVTAVAMQTWGADSFFIVNGFALAAAALALISFILRKPALRPHFTSYGITNPTSAQGAIELDPRCDNQGQNIASPARATFDKPD